MSFKQLAPWDAMSWFDIPRERTFTLTGNVDTVAIANQRRVALVFGVLNAIGVVQISVNNNVGLGSGGFGIIMACNPVIFTHQSVGPLVQVSWFAIGGVGEFLTVTEVLLRDWPEQMEDIGHVKTYSSPKPSDLRNNNRRFAPDWTKYAPGSNRGQRSGD